jgi:hypothetical protein
MEYIRGFAADRGTPMPTFDREKLNKRTTVTKDGDPFFKLDCFTLMEAIVEVDKWPPFDKDKTHFKTDGAIYTWHELVELGVVNTSLQVRP